MQPNAYLQPGITPPAATTPVYLRVNCSNVKSSLDEMTNPVVIVSVRDPQSGQWQVVGSTECQSKTWTPQFAREVVVQYRIAEEQLILLQLYDVPRGADFNGVLDPSQDTLLGYLTSRLADLFHSSTTGLTRQLQDPSGSGATNMISMTVRVSDHSEESRTRVPTEQAQSGNLVTFRLRAQNLKKTDLIGRSDPYFVVVKQKIGKRMRRKKGGIIYQSEFKKNTQNPIWKACTVDPTLLSPQMKAKQRMMVLGQMQGADQFRVEVYDHDVGSQDDLIGYVDISLSDLESAASSRGGGQQSFELVYMKHGQLIPNRGQLTCDAYRSHIRRTQAEIEPVVSFNFRGEKLKKVDLIGGADPYFIVSRHVQHGNVFGGGSSDSDGSDTIRSEVKQNNLNPRWNPIRCGISGFSYESKLDEVFRVDVFDSDEGSKDDLIGYFETNLNQLVANSKQQQSSCFELRFIDRKGRLLTEGRGKIYCDVCRIDPVSRVGGGVTPSGQIVSFNVRGVNLKKMDVLSKTDGYVVIRKIIGNGVCLADQQYVSEVIGGSLNPRWEPICLDCSELTFSQTANLDEKFRIDVFDSNQATKDQLVGSLNVSVNELQRHVQAGEEGGFELTCVQKGRVLTGRGSIFCDVCRVDPRFVRQRSSGQMLTFGFRGIGLKRMDIVGGADPYFAFRRLLGPGVPIGPQIVKSEVVHNSLNPSWVPTTIDASELTFTGVPDPNEKFRIEVFDSDAGGADDVIGFVDVSVSELQRESEEGFELMCWGKHGQPLSNRGALACAAVRMHPPVRRVRSNQIVTFNLRGVKLKKMDLVGGADPYFVLRRLLVPGPYGVPMPGSFAKSEVINNNLNPKWNPVSIDSSEFTFTGQPNFDEKFRVEVFDSDAAGSDDLIGFADVSISDLQAHGSDGFELIFFNKKRKQLPNRGHIVCDVVRIHAPIRRVKSNQIVTFNLRGLSFKKMDLVGGADPYFVLRRLLAPGPRGVAMPGSFGRSEVKNNTLNPKWDPVSIDSAEFAFSGQFDPEEKFRVEVFDSDAGGSDDLIGFADVSISELRDHGTEGFELIFFHKKKGQRLPNRGKIFSDACRIDAPFARRVRTNDIVTFNFRGVGFKRMDVVGGADPYFVLRRLLAPGPRGVAMPGSFGRSEVKNNTLNPMWNPVSIDSSEFTFTGRTDLEEKFRVEVFDSDAGGADDLIGFVDVSIAELQGIGSEGFELICFHKKKDHQLPNRGRIFCDVCRIHPPVRRQRTNQIVTFNLRGVKLKRMDLVGGADPYFVLRRLVGPGPRGVPMPGSFGKSEVCQNTLEPKWNPVSIDYSEFTFSGLAEPNEMFRIEVFDSDDGSADDLIGFADVSIVDLQSRGSEGFELFCWGKKGKLNQQLPNRGHIFCDALRIDPFSRRVKTNEFVTFNLRGLNFKKMDLVGGADPYFVLRRLLAPGPRGVAMPGSFFKSEVKNNTLNPKWNPVTVDSSEFSFTGLPNHEEKFRVEVFDSDAAGSDDMIGFADLSISELQGVGRDGFELICFHKKKGQQLPNRGHIFSDAVRFHPAIRRVKTTQIVTFNLRGVGFKRMDLVGGADPYFVLRRLLLPGPRGVAMPGSFGRSEVKSNTLNPKWDPVSIESSEFAFTGQFDPNEKFRVEVFDSDAGGSDDMIGFADVSITELQTVGLEGFELIFFHKKKDEQMPARGRIFSDAVRIHPPIRRVKTNELVTFNLRGRNFKRMDLVGGADPYFVLRRLLKPGVRGVAMPGSFFKSPVINNNLNPKWDPVSVDSSEFSFTGGLDFEEKFRIEVFDADDAGSDDMIGFTDVSLSELRDHGSEGFELIFFHKKKDEQLPDRGFVFSDAVRVHPPVRRMKTNDFVSFNLRGVNLKKMDLIGGADPYFVLRRLLLPGPRGVAMSGSFGRSEVKNNTLNPKWNPVSIDSSEFGFTGHFDPDEKFRVEVFDSDEGSSDDMIGFADVSISELQTVGSEGFDLTCFHKKKDEELPNRGRIASDICRIDRRIVRRKTNQFVTFNLRGVKLKRMDVVGGADPYFVLRRLLLAGPRGVPTVESFFKSPVKNNTLTPCWDPVSIDTSEFSYAGAPDVNEKFRIEIYDADDVGSDDLIGFADVSIVDLQTHGTEGWDLFFWSKKGQQLPNRGHIFCDGCRIGPKFRRQPTAQIVSFNLRGVKLKRMDLVGGADPYFVLRRLLAPGLPGAPMPGSFFTSEIINNNLNPKWEPVQIDFSELTYTGIPEPLEKFRVEVFDSDEGSADDMIGFFDASVAELQSAGSEGFELAFFKKGKQMPNRGHVFCDVCRIDAPRPPRKDKITLLLRGSELKKMDLGGKSDPYFVLKRGLGQGVFISKNAYRSDVKKNSLYPSWGPLFLEVGLFTFGGSPEEPLRIEVYDHDDIGADDLIGYADASMRLLQTQGVEGFELIFFNKKGKQLPNRGFLYCDLCRSDPPRPIRPEIVTFNLRGVNLKRMDLVGGADPFFIVKVGLGNGGFMESYKSPVKKNTLNPEWVVSVNYMQMTYLGNPDEPLRIEVWDADAIGSGDLIGHFETSLAQLQTCGRDHPFELIFVKKSTGRQLPKRGTMYCDVCRIDMPLPQMFSGQWEPSILFNLRGVKLKKMDGLFGKSDPYFRVRPGIGNGVFLEHTHQSETITRTLDPKWEPLQLEYSKLFFRPAQANPETKIRFDVYDYDEGSADDFIGYADVSVSELQASASSGRTIGFELVCFKKGKRLGRRGHIFCDVCVVFDRPIPTRPPGMMEETANFKLRGINLKKMDMGFGKADPYMIIKKGLGNGVFAFAHKGPVLRQTLNPSWDSIVLPVKALTLLGNLTDVFRIEVYDWDADGSDDLIGYVDICIQDLRASSRSHGEVSFELYCEDKKGRQLPNRGQIVCEQCQLEGSRFSMSQYIEGGLEICLSMAIDFNASNGDPRVPGTLHHLSPGTMNEYEAAIHMIGGMLMKLDSDNVVPLYGFGGRSTATGQVSNCFALNGNANAPCCVGVEGVLETYRNAVQTVALSGPSCMSYVTQVATQQASVIPVSQDVQVYHILVIFTNGLLDSTDVNATVEAFVASSHAPLSILIVGVGGQDFSSMKFLDADDDLLWTASGKVAARDNVEFVPFWKVRFAGPMELSQSTLTEVSKQAQKYFRERDIFPNPETAWVPIPGVQRAVPAHLRNDEDEEEGEISEIPMTAGAVAQGSVATAAPECLVTSGHIALAATPDSADPSPQTTPLDTLSSFADLRRQLRSAGTKLVIVFVTAAYVAPSVTNVVLGLPSQFPHAQFYQIFAPKKRFKKKLRVKKIPSFLIYRQNKLLHYIDDGPGSLVLQLKKL